MSIIEGSYNKNQKMWEIQNIKVEFNSIYYYKNTGSVCTRSSIPV